MSPCQRQQFFQSPQSALQLPASGLNPLTVLACRLQLFPLQLNDVSSLNQTALRFSQHPLELGTRHMDVRKFLAPVGHLKTKVSRYALLISDCRLERIHRGFRPCLIGSDGRA
jgi:hypothetical protein